VGRAADGKELGQSLEDPEKDCMEWGHGSLLVSLEKASI
jgi:hypothetical protein